ncbi:MAG: hypothetical protein AAF602_23805 [Myxococcota bacterium]
MRERLSTVHFVLAVVAMFVGVALGRFSLQSELREAHNAVAAAEAQPCEQGSAVGREIARALGGEPVVDLPDPPEPSPRPAPDPVVVEDDGFRIEIGDDDPHDVAPPPSDESFEAIADTVALRRAQSRQALIERLAPSDDQLDVIDEAYAVMNDALIDEASILLEATRDREPTRRDGLEFARNAIDAVLDAEDQVLDVLTDDQLAEVDPDLVDPLSFIEPDLIETLTELER